MKIAINEDTGEIIEQKTREWFLARLGKVTASEIENVVTPSKLGAAKGTAYLNRLVTETFLGEPIDTGDTAWTERGTEMEDDGIRWYEFERSVDVQRTGFILSDCGRMGASPDGLIGDDGMVEMKVPSAVVHMGYLLAQGRGEDALGDDHRMQCQFGLWIAKRKWIDLVSFNPAIPNVIVRMEPFPSYFEAFEKHVPPFLARLDEAIEYAESRRSLNPFA